MGGETGEERRGRGGCGEARYHILEGAYHSGQHFRRRVQGSSHETNKSHLDSSSLEVLWVILMNNNNF